MRKINGLKSIFISKIDKFRKFDLNANSKFVTHCF